MLKIDLHIHTVASGHANCTLVEFIDQAKKNRMKIIGIADHGPGSDGATIDLNYFRTLVRIPRVVNGIKILRGIEANIDNQGGLCIADQDIEALDYTIAGLHNDTEFKDRGTRLNTEAVVKVAKSGKVDIFSHPFIMPFPIDIKTVAEAACRNNVLLEVNMNYLKEENLKKHPGNLPNLKEMIKIVKSYRQKVIVGSDAHNIWGLGDDSPLKKIKKQIGLTEDLIINNYPKELMKLLKIKN